MYGVCTAQPLKKPRIKGRNKVVYTSARLHPVPWSCQRHRLELSPGSTPSVAHDVHSSCPTKLPADVRRPTAWSCWGWPCRLLGARVSDMVLQRSTHSHAMDRLGRQENPNTNDIPSTYLVHSIYIVVEILSTPIGCAIASVNVGHIIKTRMRGLLFRSYTLIPTPESHLAMALTNFHTLQ